jgi:hypothetical protein
VLQVFKVPTKGGPRKNPDPDNLCICGSGLNYKECCFSEKYIDAATLEWAESPQAAEIVDQIPDVHIGNAYIANVITLITWAAEKKGIDFHEFFIRCMKNRNTFANVMAEAPWPKFVRDRIENGFQTVIFPGLEYMASELKISLEMAINSFIEDLPADPSQPTDFEQNPSNIGYDYYDAP